MKKLFALILSVLLAFSCMSGIAETTAPQIPDFIPSEQMATGAVEISEENVVGLFSFFGIEVEETDLTLLKSLIKLINACNLSIAYDLEAGCVECILSLNDTPAVNFSVAKKDGQFVFQSDLIPSYALTLPEEALDALTEQTGAMLESYTALLTAQVQAFIPAAQTAAAYLPALIAPLTEKIEGPNKVNLDTGSYVFDTSYTLNTTVAEIAPSIADSVAALLQDETVAAFLSDDIGLTLTEEDMDDFKTKLAAIDATISAQIVTCSKNGAMYADVAVQFAENTAYMLFQTEGSVVLAAGGYGPSAEDPNAIYTAAAQGEDAIWIEAAYDAANNWGYMDAIFAGLYLGLEGITVEEEGDMLSRTDLYFINTESPLLSVFTGLFQNAEFLDEDFDTEGLVSIDAQKLLEGDTDTINMLTEDFATNGINVALGAIATAMPDDVDGIFAVIDALLQ